MFAALIKTDSKKVPASENNWKCGLLSLLEGIEVTGPICLTAGFCNYFEIYTDKHKLNRRTRFA